MNKKTRMWVAAAGVAVLAGVGGGGVAYYFWKKSKSSGCNASSCPSGMVCVRGKCEPVECNADPDCKNGKVCEGSKCVDPFCSVSKKCTNRTDKCSGGRCVPGRCPTDYECLEGSACDQASGSCVEKRDCTSEGFTCASGTVCDRVSKACVIGECSEDLPCSDISKKCDISSKKCIPKKCPSEYSCPYGTYCDTLSGSCVVSECDTESPCADSSKKCDAVQHKCVPKVCPSDFTCEAGTVCDSATGKCGGSACGDSQHRCPATFMCDPGTKTCIKGVQKCPLDFDCGLGYACDSPSGTCVKSGCFQDADCPTNFTCNLNTHGCVVIPDKKCPVDFVCDPGLLCGQDGKCTVDQAGRMPDDTAPIDPTSPTANVIRALNKGYTWSTTPTRFFRITGSPRQNLSLFLTLGTVAVTGWRAWTGGIDLFYPSHVVRLQYVDPLNLSSRQDISSAWNSLTPV